MAERRMFAKTIVTSDAFLDMPATTRCLYFMLSMLADDGFVNSPRSVMRQSGATEDDLKLLLAKRYILGFESGVVVIKHWKIHNIIAKDRYKETSYLEEKATLTLDDKKAYIEADNILYTGCIQNGNKMETQVRLGKDSIGKDRLNNTTTTHTHEDDVDKTLKAQYVSIGDGSAYLFISDAQILALVNTYNEETLGYYLHKMCELNARGTKRGCSDYEYIIRLIEEDKKVRKK